MTPTLGTEKSTVQNPIVKYAGEIGWNFVSQEDALSLRKGESGTLFYPVHEEKLLELNDGLVNRENVDEIIHRMEAVRNNIEGNGEDLGGAERQQNIEQ
jgi:type I restriction enzyme, R subunit